MFACLVVDGGACRYHKALILRNAAIAGGSCGGGGRGGAATKAASLVVAASVFTVHGSVANFVELPSRIHSCVTCLVYSARLMLHGPRSTGTTSLLLCSGGIPAPTCMFLLVLRLYDREATFLLPHAKLTFAVPDVLFAFLLSLQVDTRYAMACRCSCIWGR